MTNAAKDVVCAGQAGADKIELVEVTPEMLEAGLEEARELASRGDTLEYVVSAIYLAME